MDTKGICQLLDWDTAFFGMRIARLIPSRVTESILRQALSWCQSEAIECLYFLADSNYGESIQLIEQGGFNLVDIRVTFERSLSEMDTIDTKGVSEISIRPSQLDDVPYLKAIAREIYQDTRFYWDPHFPQERASALYAVWIEKSCKGYAERVLVLEKNAEPVGYITCHITNPQLGRIGLVGVHRKIQNVGAGQHLVHSALQWFASCGVKRADVVTQGRNCKAQSLYEKCGFRTQKVQLWYHKWFNT